MSSKIVISVSGKGGTGKTTFTSLLLNWIIKNTDEVALVVDADPATNLPDVLGVELYRTVGQVSKDMKDQIERGARARNVQSFNMTGKPLLDIPEDSPSYRAIEEIAKKIGLENLV